MKLESRRTLPLTQVHPLAILFDGSAHDLQVLFGEACRERKQVLSFYRACLPLGQCACKVKHFTLVFDLEFVELL
jgi:hypothetical protein